MIKTTPKTYKYKYNSKTGLLEGTTRDLTAANTTDKEPIFDPDSRTVWDKELNAWKLVSREDYWQLIGAQNYIQDYESKILPVIQNTLKNSQAINADTLYMIDVKQTRIEDLLKQTLNKLHTLNQLIDRNQSWSKNYADTLHSIQKNFLEIKLDTIELNTTRALNNLRLESRSWLSKLLSWLFHR